MLKVKALYLFIKFEGENSTTEPCTTVVNDPFLYIRGLMFFFFSFQITLPWNNSNFITTIVPSGVKAQYLKFAPWRPLTGEGLCLRIDVFRHNSSCKNTFIKL